MSEEIKELFPNTNWTIHHLLPSEHDIGTDYFPEITNIRINALANAHLAMVVENTTFPAELIGAWRLTMAWLSDSELTPEQAESYWKQNAAYKKHVAGLITQEGADFLEQALVINDIDCE